MEVLKTVLIVLELIASLALIVVVLMQSGKESGLSGAISGNSNSYMNKNKTGGLDTILATSTKWLAPVWILLALTPRLILQIKTTVLPAVFSLRWIIYMSQTMLRAKLEAFLCTTYN